MRAQLHYLIAIFLFWLLGVKISPFIKDLDPFVWIAILLIVFTPLYILRTWGQKILVLGAPLEVQPRRQFILDLSIFYVAGILAKLGLVIEYNVEFFGGFMVGLVGMVTGLYAGADLALEREFIVSSQLKKINRKRVFEEELISLTRKFMMGASFTILLSTAIFLELAFRSVHLGSITPPEDIPEFRLKVLLTFVTAGVFVLLHTVNLIRSLSRNLNSSFANHNKALISVARGDLDAQVPYSMHEEFRVMAKYTNYMIEELKARTREVEITQDVTILSMATTAEIRDPSTGAHIMRTQRYVRELAEELSNLPAYREALTPKNIELMFKSAPLHDIGKVGVPDAILNKPGKLTDEEFEEMKKHADYGKDILRKAEEALGSTSFLRYAREIAHTHQEKWDGTGYPQGLKGEEIPISGRLMALADVYDALVSSRVYKPAFSHEETVEIIKNGRGTHFDPVVVDAFVNIADRFRDIAEKFQEMKPEEKSG